MKLALLSLPINGYFELPAFNHHTVWRGIKAVAVVSVLYVLPGSASAVVVYDAGALDFESSGQSMWASGDAFRKEESFFLGTQWSNRTATLGGIAGSARVMITPHIPATYSPYVPAVTSSYWEPRVYNLFTDKWVGCGCTKTTTITPAIPSRQLTPEFAATYADTRTGAQLDVNSSGKVGLEFGYTIDSGSVDSSVGFSALAELPEAINASEFFSLNAGSLLDSGTIDTQSPKIEAYISSIMELSGSVKATACATLFGCRSSTTALPGIDMDQRVLSIDPDGVKILDGALAGGEPLAVLALNNQSITLEGGVSVGPPPVAGFKLAGPGGVTLASTMPPTPAVTIDMAKISIQAPDIATSGTKSGAGLIASGGRDDLLSVQLDLDGMASIMAGLPPAGLNTTLLDAHGLKIEGKLDIIDVDAGPVLGITQDFELTPTLMVDLAFNNPIKIAGMSGLQSSWTGVWDDLPDLALLETTTFTPTFWLDAMLENEFGLDLGLVGTLDFFKLSATASAGGIDFLNFGVASLNQILGFGNTLFETDKLALSVFAGEFALGGFNRVLGNPFTLSLGSTFISTRNAGRSGGTVPEPGTLWGLVLGLIALSVAQRRKGTSVSRACLH